jgi:myo-inositol-1-phosphate synthase
MSGEDSPSAAPVILDAVRAAKLAPKEQRAGVLQVESARLMKAPPTRA